MFSRVPRLVRWVVVVAAIGALSAAVFQSWRADTSSANSSDGWTQTESGPLGPADRDLLAKVRQAGLWEMPTGQQMQQRASSQRVREVGGLIATEHQQLDAIVRDTASKLGVLLPSQPTDEQRGWMDQISAQSGADYDRVSVNLLRLAHGRVLPILAAERSGTRNALIRQFADTATEFVHRHHTYLESTGLVDFAALPQAPAPASAAAAPAPAIDRTSATSPLDGSDRYPAAVVFIAAILGIVGLLLFMLRRRPRPTHAEARRRAVHTPKYVEIPAPRRSRHAIRRW